MTIDTFLTTFFWLYIVSITIRGLALGFLEYPREETKSVGADTVGLLLNIAILVWIIILRSAS